jgi:hypothetical protein
MADRVQNVKDLLWQIGKTYPSIGGLLQKKYPNGGTVGNHWAKLLADLDFDHLENVCYEYAEMKRQPPEEVDQIAFAILEEVKLRTWKDEERRRTHELRLAARTKSADFMGSDPIGCRTR